VLAAAGTPDAAAVAATAQGKTSRLGEAFITVVKARTGEQVTPEELQILGNIAGGAVSIDPAVRVQAAWLYLRHADRLDAAIDAIADFSDTPESPASEGGAG